MELLADRDPEDARALPDPVVALMVEAVHHYDTVNQVMGDGIMALFGAPLAHEDHHVHGVNVQIRVGLHSGEVVVRAIGSDLHMDYTPRSARQPTWRRGWSSSRPRAPSC